MKPLTAYQIRKVKELGEKVFKRTKSYSKKQFFYYMEGACGVASGWVLDELNKLNIKAKAILIKRPHHEDGHIFVLINNEYVMDITYLQFNHGFKSFAFIHKSKRKQLHGKDNIWFWNLRGMVIKNKTELINIQIKENWTNEQIAF